LPDGESSRQGKENRPVTIKEIAKIAGVAPTTVSLVLKDSPKISPETKRHVLRIVEEMEYFPNQSGKLLKQGRTDAVAVLSSYFQNIFKMEFMNGVERAVFGTKFQLRQFYAEPGREQIKCKEILYGKMADAVIALSILTARDFMKRMKAAHKPVVLVEDVIEGYPGVTFDNYGAAYRAVEYLAAAGRRRIAVSLALKAYMGHRFVDERLRGYVAALRDLGLEYSEIIELPEYSVESGASILRRIREKNELPDALFCASGDITAAGFLKEAAAQGVRIPDDIAVMGFDDSIIAQSTTLGLTTIRQPVFEMGKAALELALALIEGDTESWSKVIVFKPEIVVRSSA
jgi:DNA-binding LacI/PurR family transcriptional regulator